ncbi:Ribonuclease D [Labilithrix luteola]|uniref:Ribonuclease D n=1 Tax=Labilithrix luteola TaxID=1391654 RepID=A0A0K1Q7B0_9BACT|nr:Ribonuclease D [Labilithrix luteola]
MPDAVPTSKTDPSTHPVSLVTTEPELVAAAKRLGQAPTVAFDLESNGLFAYRATACLVQLSSADEIVIVDAMATPLAPLADLLGSDRTVKIVHDVAFDARILAENGVHLANVRDTSVAARMLGRTATGLASLLSSELGISIDKALQQHDWGKRPLDAHALAYLSGDVQHLQSLADKLWAEVNERNIGDAIDEETRYRLSQAIDAAKTEDIRPPYIRLKGIDRAAQGDLPILKRLADLREARAKELDVPPYKVLGPDILFAIAQRRPKTMDDLARIRGATAGHRARSIARDVLRAVASGIADAGIPEEDRAMLQRPRLPSAIAKARRAREQRLTRWRKIEAKQRGIDEQVVLPGHCLQDIADLDEPSVDDLYTIAGIGRFRVERDGAAILAALNAPDEASP